MTRLLLSGLLLLFISNQYQAQIIWYENFDGLADSTYEDNGSSAWTKYDAGITLVDGGINDYFIVRNERFEGRDMLGEGVWSSEVVDISGYPAGVDLKIDLWQLAGYLEPTDYLRAYYVLDGGAETLFVDGDQTDDITSGIVNAYVDGLVGDSVRIVVRMNLHTGSAEREAFDNIFVLETGANPLYSIASGAWEDGNNWSKTSGGAACNCIPGPTTDVYVESGYTMDVSVESYFNSIDITGNSSIRWTVGADLIGFNGGTISIESGSNMNRNGKNAVVILQSGGYTITSNDAAMGMEISDLIIRGDQDVTFEGSGRIYLRDDFIDEGGDHTITNNLTGTFTVHDQLMLRYSPLLPTASEYGPITFIHSGTAGLLDIHDDLRMDKDTIVFTNNGSITVTDRVRFMEDEIVFNNNNTIAARRLEVGGSGDDNNIFNNNTGNTASFTDEVDMSNSASFTLNNYGNLSMGFFKAIDPADSFVNHSNATWTITGTGNDLDAALDATAANNVVVYNSASAQELLAPVSGYYKNLTLDGGSIKTAQGNISVHDLFTITNGDVDLNTNSLTLGQSAASTGTLSHTTGSIYNGDFSRYLSSGIIADGAIEGFFPMGDVGETRPIYISAPTAGPTTGGLITVTHTDDGTTDDVSFFDGGDEILRTDDASWTIITGGGIAGGTYEINAGGTGLGIVTDIDDLRLTLSGSVVGSHGTTAGTTSNPMITRTGLSLADLANTFHISSLDLASPLPIELLTFQAMYNNGIVELNWSTATEINNDYFEIERSFNGEEFETILTVDGAGNSSSIIDYFERDIEPLSGVSFYRLKQTDYDGTFTYSDIVPMKINENQTDFSVFTNPTSPDNIKVNFDGMKGKEVLLVIRDIEGKEFYSKMQVVESDHQLTAIQTDRNVPDGIYLIIASSDDQLFSKKIVIQN